MPVARAVSLLLDWRELTEHRESGSGTWFLVLHVIGSLDAWPVVREHRAPLT
jgi:hypothetical protein